MRRVTGWVREVVSLRLLGLVILQLKIVEHFTEKITKQTFTSSPAHRSFLVFAFAALSAIVFALTLQIAVRAVGLVIVGGTFAKQIGNWTGSVVGVRGVISGGISPS